MRVHYIAIQNHHIFVITANLYTIAAESMNRKSVTNARELRSDDRDQYSFTISENSCMIAI